MDVCTELLIATRNPGKVAEFRELFASIPNLQLRSMMDVEQDGWDMPTLVEDGLTFEDNARVKAVVTARATGMLTLADDSGLEVQALNGAPGVHSARYAGLGACDADNNAKLIQAMENVEDDNRQARFCCVLALADPKGPLGDDVHYTTGYCEGRIASEASGKGGFGYDPLFVPKGLDKSFAELGSDEKNRRSHRSAAATQMCSFLRDYCLKRQ